jgi:hypothetical protein
MTAFFTFHTCYDRLASIGRFLVVCEFEPFCFTFGTLHATTLTEDNGVSFMNVTKQGLSRLRVSG